MPQVTTYPSGSKVEIYKSAITENYERAEAYWGGNDFVVRTTKGGTGSLGTMNFNASVVRVNATQVETKGHTHVAGDITGAAAWVSIPPTSSSPGVMGQMAHDGIGGFLYVCVATNQWRRTALTTW
jgi:hypothetical protein